MASDFFVVACVKFMIMKSLLIRDELFCLGEKKNLKADAHSKHIDLFSLACIRDPLGFLFSVCLKFSACLITDKQESLNKGSTSYRQVLLLPGVVSA